MERLQDNNGETAGASAIARDIAENKRAEECLRESEERYKGLAQACPDGVMMSDLNGRLLFASPQMWQLLGLAESEELVGGSVLECVTEGDRQRLAANLADLLEKGVRRNTEYTALRRDGTTLPVETSTAVIRDAQGRPQAVMGIIRDITDRKQAEMALHRSEVKFRTLYDSTSDAVMLLDENGLFFDCNRAALQIFGSPDKTDFCNRHPADLSPVKQPCGMDSRTLANRQLATAMEKGSNRFEWTHKRFDSGEVFAAEVLLNALELDGRQVVQAVVRDVSERKQAEQQIKDYASALRAHRS